MGYADCKCLAGLVETSKVVSIVILAFCQTHCKKVPDFSRLSKSDLITCNGLVLANHMLTHLAFLQFLLSGQYGFCFGYCFSGPLPLRYFDKLSFLINHLVYSTTRCNCSLYANTRSIPPVPTYGSISVVLWLLFFRYTPSTFPQRTGHLLGAISGKSARFVLALKLSVTTTHAFREKLDGIHTMLNLVIVGHPFLDFCIFI